MARSHASAPAFDVTPASVRREGDARVIPAARVVHERAQDGLARDAVAVRDDVDRDVVLLELLRELDHGLLVRAAAREGRRDEHDDALAQVLVLAVLERELRDGERGGDVDGPADFGGRGVQGGEDVPQVFCVRHEDFGAGEGAVSASMSR